MYSHSLPSLPPLRGAPQARAHVSPHAHPPTGGLLRAGLHAIHDLRLAFTRVGDTGLAALARASPRLHTLTLGAQHDNITLTGTHTDAGLAALRRAAPGVRVRLVSA